MHIIYVFDSVDDALDYRYNNGTGGWIFAPDAPPANPHHAVRAQVILFPPEFTPSVIFNHAMTRGQSGRLISN